MGILFKNVVKSLSNSRYVFRNSSSINPLLYIPKRHVQLDNTNNLLKKLPLVRRLHGSNDDDMHYFSLLSTENDRYFSPEKELHLPFPQIRPSPVNVVGSCNGVVCLEDKAVEGRTVLWNPSTNEFKVLPPSCIERHPSAAYIQFWSSGFGFDLNSQDYKVIRFAENVFETEEGYYARTESQVELYSLKSDSWKEIPDPNMSPWPSPSAYVNGVFYWVADAEMRPDFILSYDFANQKFSSFPFPDSGKRMGAYTLELLEWDGSLSAIIYPFYGTEKSFDLWVMNDESWSRVSIFPVPAVVGPLGFWTKDQLLVEGINHELKLFDLATRELKHLRIYDYPETLQFIPCVESNVQLNGKSEFEEADAEIKELSKGEAFH